LFLTTVRQTPFTATLSPNVNSSARCGSTISRRVPAPSGETPRTVPRRSTSPVNIAAWMCCQSTGSMRSHFIQLWCRGLLEALQDDVTQRHTDGVDQEQQHERQFGDQ